MKKSQLGQRKCLGVKGEQLEGLDLGQRRRMRGVEGGLARG